LTLAFSAIVATYLSRLTAHPPILPNAQSLARSAASHLGITHSLRQRAYLFGALTPMPGIDDE
jgi:hypothetical protein